MYSVRIHVHTCIVSEYMYMYIYCMVLYIPLVCVLAQDKEYLVYSITSEHHLIIPSSSEVHQIDPRTHLLMNEEREKKRNRENESECREARYQVERTEGEKDGGKEFCIKVNQSTSI